MGKQKALEYAEAKLAEANAAYEALEEHHGKDLENVYESVSDSGNYDDAYEMGTEIGEVSETIGLMTNIIKLLNEEDN